jgi:5-methylcytosine-specific restriction enzyme subunit McrC
MPTTRAQLTLREWQPTELELDSDDALALAEGPARVSVDPLGAGRYRVTPSHFVGSLALPSADVVVRPKVGVSRLFFLLGYARRLRFEGATVELEKALDITDAVVQAFLVQARTALRRGPLMSYRWIEESQPTIRGRVRLLDQSRRRFGMPLPVEVAYDDFTIDVDENRLLKAALRRANHLRLRDPAAKRRIAETLGVLPNVADVQYDSRALPTIPINRLNRHYEMSLELARLILKSSTTELLHGGVRAPNFVVDMDKVFEDFVFAAIGDELKVPSARWRQGKGMTLDVAGRVRIKPDLTLWGEKMCRFVGDVKYKVTEVGEHGDLYQVLSYARATGLAEALLIYASAEEPVQTHVVRNDGTTLHVRSVDLEGSEPELRQDIASLASLVREIAGITELAPT